VYLVLVLLGRAGNTIFLFAVVCLVVEVLSWCAVLYYFGVVCVVVVVVVV